MKNELIKSPMVASPPVTAGNRIYRQPNAGFRSISLRHRSPAMPKISHVVWPNSCPRSAAGERSISSNGIQRQRGLSKPGKIQISPAKSSVELRSIWILQRVKSNDEAFSAPENNAFGHSFRDYDKESERRAGVENFYKTNHINQTCEFTKKKKEDYGELNRAEMSLWDCCELLDEFVDESDPDLDEPQIQHLLQSAEAIRRDYPNQDWLHLTALIHDLGKVLLHPKFGGEPQWCVAGDTYPLGCAFDESIVYHKYFAENPDSKHPIYSTKLGIYKEKCGLQNVTMSWGHDEYMYMVMKENKTTLPSAGLFIIRFHSFYPMHRNGAYSYLMNEEDRENLEWLKIFNKYDLYSKSKIRVDVDKVKPYYLSLIEKYFPAKLRW